MKKLALAFALSLAGCGALAAPNPKEDLQESVMQYNDGVRWERFINAAEHIPPKERSGFLDEADERAKEVKITDYEIVRVERKPNGSALVQIKISWYKEVDNTVHETHSVQTWEHKNHNWLMVEESRLRGSEMPGLAEPPSEAERAAKDRPQASETGKQSRPGSVTGDRM